MELSIDPSLPQVARSAKLNAPAPAWDSLPAPDVSRFPTAEQSALLDAFLADVAEDERAASTCDNDGEVMTIPARETATAVQGGAEGEHDVGSEEDGSADERDERTLDPTITVSRLTKLALVDALPDDAELPGEAGDALIHGNSLLCFAPFLL